MIAIVSLIILATLYISFLRESGALYDFAIYTMQWLSLEHGQTGLLGWLFIVLATIAWMIKTEKTEATFESENQHKYVKAITTSGLTCEKNWDDGELQHELEADILFEDGVYIFEMKQKSGSNGDTSIEQYRFLDWKSLCNHIQHDTVFNLEEFYPIPEGRNRAKQLLNSPPALPYRQGLSVLSRQPTHPQGHNK